MMPSQAARAAGTDRFLDVRFVDRLTKQPLPKTIARIRVGNDGYNTQADEHGYLRISLPADQPEYVCVNGVQPGDSPLTWRRSAEHCPWRRPSHRRRLWLA